MYPEFWTYINMGSFLNYESFYFISSIGKLTGFLPVNGMDFTML